jgi:hypothetical protein
VISAAVDLNLCIGEMSGFLPVSQILLNEYIDKQTLKKVVILYNPAPELEIFQTGDSLSMHQIWIKKNNVFVRLCQT